MDNSQKTQIEKLMELKQLYEKGILTKEEMEIEKRKILGMDIETTKEILRQEKTISSESQQHIEIEEPVKPFFQKYKSYIFGGIALLIVMAGIIFVPKIITRPSVSVSDGDSIPEINTLALKGSINDKIGFTMHLTAEGTDIEGTEHYDNQKKDVNIVIKGINSDDGKMVLYEYDGNTKAGVFEGIIEDNIYSGTFTNSKGKNMSFTARVLSEADLARIEEEERQFETKKIVYKKNTSSAIVELSVDYPIKGSHVLLQNTRNYVSGVIAAMFSINEYGGSLNDGNTVINSYGKRKYDGLDSEWKENAYEGASAYIETIEFTKDFENEYCVSLCAHSYYFHGGVSNEFCDASTFRKVDGKHINIIRSINDKGLHKLIITAVKNKLGDDYESVNEEFESSPMAGIIHLVKSGVQFDYQHYEIGPGALRQVSITIPYEKIMPYMTEEAKNIIDGMR